MAELSSPPGADECWLLLQGSIRRPIGRLPGCCDPAHGVCSGRSGHSCHRTSSGDLILQLQAAHPQPKHVRTNPGHVHPDSLQGIVCAVVVLAAVTLTAKKGDGTHSN